MKKRWSFIVTILKGLTLTLLTVITFCYAMFQGGFVSWFLFYSFLPFAILCLLVGFAPLRSFQVDRQLSRHEYKAGDSLEVTVTLKRNNRLPLPFLLIEENFPKSLQASTNAMYGKALVFPWFRKEVTVSYKIDSLPRGEHVFSAIRLKTGDPIGLFEKEWSTVVSQTILVYPALKEMMYRPLDTKYDQGAAVSSVIHQKDTSLVTGVRDYQTGDRFSWVHWKAFARTNQLMTKEFEERQSHDVLLVLDRREHPMFESMVTLVASATQAILKRGAQVGLLSAGDERTYIPPKQGDAQKQQVLYHLAKVTPDTQKDLGIILHGERFGAQQAVTLFVVTATISEALVDIVSVFAKRKGVVVLFVVKPKGSDWTSEEHGLRSVAIARGVHVRLLTPETITTAFTEVGR